LGALAIAFIVYGCGAGDDVGTDGGTTGPTKAAYIKWADAICSKTNGLEADGISKWEVKHGAVKPGFKSPTSSQELKVIMPMIRREIKEIAALEPPMGEQAEVDAFVSAYQEASKETIAELLDGESEKYQRAFTLMQKYGFKICGSS
jgi:hypothetical protein